MSSSSSLLQPTAASGSITLRTPVTKPHAMEQRPLPDSANYSDPLRGTNAASTDGRTEVCSFACLGKEETKPVLMLMGFFLASGLKRLFKVSIMDHLFLCDIYMVIVRVWFKDQVKAL